MVLASAVLVAAACGKEGGGGTAGGPAVVTVNDKTYSAADVEREISQELRRAPREIQQALSTRDGQKRFLERLVRRELLVQEAEKRKIGDRPEIADQVSALRRELMLRALLQEEIGSKVSVEDKDVQDYFTAHADEFSGDQVRARHILLRTEEEAKQVLERLANREPFEDLAKALSRDAATAGKGGDLDYFGREQMVPEFARAAFALKPGEVSGVVKTQFGFHVIKLVDRRKGQPLTFEQVKDQLRKRLLEERQNQRFQGWIKGLEQGAKIVRDESLLPVGKFAPAMPATPGPAGEDAKSGEKL
jgi:peptidyl-prolyl cis-trans isomerase C